MFPNNPIYLFSRKPKDESLDQIKGLNRVILNEDFVNFITPATEKEDNEEEVKEVGKKKAGIYNSKDGTTSTILGGGSGYRNTGDDNGSYLQKSSREYGQMMEESSSEEDEKEEYEQEVAKNDPLEYFSNSCCIFDDVDTITDTQVAKKVKKLQGDLQETGRSREITVLNTAHLLLGGHSTKRSLCESSFVCVFPSRGDRSRITSYLSRYQGLDRDQIKKIYSLPSRWVVVYCTSPRFILYDCGCYFLD